ncbi:MAG: hypothetical protein HY289_14740 [Planctomycetes bacterium]|nr:hypothetical protein [Planctomycetota bacterium]
MKYPSRTDSPTAAFLRQIRGVTNIVPSDANSATFAKKCDQSEVKDNKERATEHYHRAVQLLDATKPNDRVLKRFRDEARQVLIANLP